MSTNLTGRLALAFNNFSRLALYF